MRNRSVAVFAFVLTALALGASSTSIGQYKCCGEDFSGCCQDRSECCMIYNKSEKAYDIGCCGVGEACCGSNKCCGINQTCCRNECCSDECFFNFACLPTFGLSRNLFIGLAAGIVLVVILVIILVITCSCRVCHNASKKKKEKRESDDYIEMSNESEMKKEEKKTKKKKTFSRKHKSSDAQAANDQCDQGNSAPGLASQESSGLISTTNFIQQSSQDLTEDEKTALLQNCQAIKPLINGIIRLYVFEKIDLSEYSELVSMAYASTMSRPLSELQTEKSIEIIENLYAALVVDGNGNKAMMVPETLNKLRNAFGRPVCETFIETLGLLREAIERSADDLGSESASENDSERVIEYCVCVAIINFDTKKVDPNTFMEDFKTWIEEICKSSSCEIEEYAKREELYEKMFTEALKLLPSQS